MPLKGLALPQGIETKKIHFAGFDDFHHLHIYVFIALSPRQTNPIWVYYDKSYLLISM